MSQKWVSETTRAVEQYEHKISASATKTLKRCPEQFRLKYIENLPSTDPESKYLKLGTGVHTSIENVIQSDEFNSIVDRPNQLREKLLSEFRSLDPDIDDEMTDVGLSCLKTAARYLHARSDEKIRDVEREFEFALDRPDIDSAFQGKIDISTRNEVWDWKTGKNVYEEDEIIQGMLYAMGFYQEFGVVPDKVRFLYLREDLQKERAIEPNDENWSRALDHVRRVVDAKDADEYPPEPDSTKCYFCSREGWCDASVVGCGGIRYEVF